MIVLSHEEILKERRAMEANEEFVNSMFKCHKCICTFANKDDLDEHNITKHHASKFVCSVCERSFASEHSAAVHSRGHSRRWRCSLCAHLSGTERAARSHHRDRHRERRCQAMFELAAKAYQSYRCKLEDGGEENRPKPEEKYPCKYCNKTFRWKPSLRLHMETHSIEAGQKRRPYCETCRLSFTTSLYLRKHVKKSSKHQIQLNLRKLQEDISVNNSDTEQQSKDLETIKSKINGQKERFQCPLCEKKFQWKGNLLRHLKSHATRANGGLVCEPCNRTFSSIATYKQHMKISKKHVSENEFKFICSDCEKRFASKRKLSDHIDWEHLKNYTHTCTDCEKVFKSDTSLLRHRQVVHRQYSAEHLCDHCGKSFPNKTKLRDHITTIHTRDSPYKCDTCSARFNRNAHLSRHVRRVHKSML